jgi:glycine/D-amino acid oxidase-like deaminating enzyme
MTDNAPEFDYLIVGHGIGGLSIAWHLQQAGKTFKIIHNSIAPNSSRVAAGILNPLTGKKLVKTWLADDLFPYAYGFYEGLEATLHARFLHRTSVYRPFRSLAEQNTYLAQTAEPAIARYVGEGRDQASVATYTHMEHGALEVTGAGWIDLPLLLDKSIAYFSETGRFIDGIFDFHDLNLSGEHVKWKGNTYGKLILCQGFAAVTDPVFDWLPFAPVKGQVLEIETEQKLEPHIVNQGIFILPVGENKARVGATYSWDPLDWVPTKQGRQELEEKLSGLLKSGYTVTAEVAGVRPSVKDRRPLIGVHPVRNNICIFNGLGTKGVTLGPYFANELVQHLENGKELNSLVNIQRYFSLYFH